MVWTLLALVSTFALPQLLGVLLHFRLSRYPKWLAFALGVLAPGMIFFYVAPAFFFAGLREAAAKGPISCGMPAVAAGFMVLLGTVAQLFVALIVQLSLLKRSRLS